MRVFYIILSAVVMLLLLSLVPWGRLTDGKIKDFNLLSDLFDSKDEVTANGSEFIDPELLAEMEHEQQPDTIAVVQPETTTEVEVSAGEHYIQPAPPERDAADKPSRIDGEMVMEDYTADGTGLDNIKSALSMASTRPVRIAVIGDSYIEGDIFTKDIRRLLQAEYGGGGVGYMAAHSIVQGFRNTVSHTDSGWTQVGIRDNKSKYNVLPGEYHVGSDGAKVSYKGAKGQGLDAWDVSRLLFIAPDSGTITISTDVGSETFDVSAGESVQEIRIDGHTTKLDITNNVPGLVYLGAWLENPAGVVLDNMSLRGYSGISHRGVDVALSRRQAVYTDYDLIVVEYGINALSSAQSDYHVYSNMMAAVATRLRQAYPNADIVMMGVGDRGQKIGGAVHSLPTTANMVQAQRRAARNAGVVFWDTREAMGGEDAVVDWRSKGYINPDYIHLNGKGGAALAEIFVNSLKRSIGE